MHPLECFREVLYYFEQVVLFYVVNVREVHCPRSQQPFIVSEYADLAKSRLDIERSQEGVALLVQHGHLPNVNVVHAVCLVLLDEEVVVFDEGLLEHKVYHLCHHFNAELLVV